MINLKTHTEFSFRYAYGKIQDIISNCKEVACITDRNTTFGHIPFWNECKKQGKKCILGVELYFVSNATLKVRQSGYWVTLLARNSKGLKKIYELTSKATEQKYYVPRLGFDELQRIDPSDVVIIFTDSEMGKYLMGRANTLYGISPLSNECDYLKQQFHFNM